MRTIRIYKRRSLSFIERMHTFDPSDLGQARHQGVGGLYREYQPWLQAWLRKKLVCRHHVPPSWKEVVSSPPRPL